MADPLIPLQKDATVPDDEGQLSEASSLENAGDAGEDQAARHG